MDTCATCACYAAIPMECRAKSPTGAFVTRPDGQSAIMGFFPGTKPDNWCAEWRAPVKKGGIA